MKEVKLAHDSPPSLVSIIDSRDCAFEARKEGRREESHKRQMSCLDRFFFPSPVRMLIDLARVQPREGKEKCSALL